MRLARNPRRVKLLLLDGGFHRNGQIHPDFSIQLRGNNFRPEETCLRPDDPPFAFFASIFVISVVYGVH